MGLTPYPAVKLYWQTDSLHYGNKYIQQLTQQKFWKINQVIHMDIKMGSGIPPNNVENIGFQVDS